MKHIELTQEQLEVKEKVTSFLNEHLEASASAKEYVTVGGYAGTGKTTMIRSIRSSLKPSVKFHYLAYTGKASMRIVHTLGEDYFQHYPEDQATTIHKAIYRVKQDRFGRFYGFDFDPDKTQQDVIIVDEASMVPQHIFYELLEKQRPIIFIGDHGQLPPITKNGEEPFNLMSAPEYTLTTIHRNVDGIKLLAKDVREQMPLTQYDNVTIKPKQELAYLKGYDPQEDIIIAGYNYTRKVINKSILRRLGFTKELEVGMKVIACRNNWKLDPPIFNGQIFYVKEILKQEDEYYLVSLEDELGTLYEAIQIAKYAFNQKVPYAPKSKHLTNRRGEYIYIPYIPMQYAYCITCHKAQGSEWDKVFVINEAFGDEENKRRWLYTAVTRASKELVLYAN